MSPWYGYTPPLPDEQHHRLIALRRLTSRGIQCILWGEDALNYVHQGWYTSVPFSPEYADYADGGGNGGPTPFPRGILLKVLDLPDDDPNKLVPLPTYILLLPQSYFDLDVRSKERFDTLVPPLPPSNANILVPKFHTFLEGLVAFNVNPPIPLATPHVKQRVKHDIYIGYLLRYRVQYEVDVMRPLGVLLPEERVILSELQTEEARWYIGKYFNRNAPGFDELRNYNSRRGYDAPEYILLLPQSYFGLDVKFRSKERFDSLVPPLPPSNADILAPKYHTFLEGLVAFNLNPPIRPAHSRLHTLNRGRRTTSTSELLPEERAILAELRTEEARWYIGRYLGMNVPGFDELREYNRRRG
ncbi:hypothetical protein V8D89_003279 [Ganoderma adspersum]